MVLTKERFNAILLYVLILETDIIDGPTCVKREPRYCGVQVSFALRKLETTVRVPTFLGGFILPA